MVDVIFSLFADIATPWHDFTEQAIIPLDFCTFDNFDILL